ncbi:MAG: DUF3368 domain-containing protein [Sedimenticola sp.]
MAEALLVADAGPLIGLAKVGRLHLLHDLFPRVVITESVRDESLYKETPDAHQIRKALDDSWMECLPDPDSFCELRKGLGSGEYSSIQLALVEPATTLLLLDDGLARKEARRQGLQFIGTAMLLIMAEERGLIEKAEPVAVAMAGKGYRISEAIFRLIRGETDKT